jgi:hypothetical protein
MLLVLIERGGADAVQVAARERRLEQVGRIHRAVGLAGADQGVHLVDEQDDAAFARGDFGQHRLQPLLELAAIFCTRNQRAKIEREQLLVLQTLRHVAVDDAQRQSLDDGGLADAGLADQHRIVLGAAGQHLDGAADFLVATDDGIELAVARGLRQVAGIFLQRVIGILGRGGIRSAALAQGLDRRIEVLRGEPALAQNAAGFAALVEREPEQEPLDGDKAVAGLFSRLLGGIEGTRQVRREIDLARPTAGHFRQFVQRILGRLQDGARIAAGAVDQTARQALAVIKQNFQDMQRRELLVAIAHGKRLRRLDEAARTFGVFFNIHCCLFPSACHHRPVRHDCGIFIGYPRVRVDIPQPAAVVALVRLEPNVGMACRERKGLLHKIASHGFQPGNPLRERHAHRTPRAPCQHLPLPR